MILINLANILNSCIATIESDDSSIDSTTEQVIEKVDETTVVYRPTDKFEDIKDLTLVYLEYLQPCQM